MTPTAPKAILLLLAFLPAGISAQEAPEMTRTFGSAGDTFLFQVRAAAPRGASLAVLTEPDPAIHVFSPGGAREWGAAGGGPGELASPADVAWVDGSIFVLDVGQPKFVRYDEDGAFVASRPTEGLRARRLWIRGIDTVLATFTPMTDARAAVRLVTGGIDTLFAWEERGPSIRLEAEGAPSFTVKPPFQPQVVWTVLADGALVRYEPGSNRLEWLDRDGRRTAATAVPWEGLPLADEDREWWIDDTIPEEFMGQRVFEPLRPVARERLEFPERLPPVLDAIEDAVGGVWLRRSTPVRGERWALVGRDGVLRGEIVLPARRELLATGETELFALARDELGIERIEAYGKPAFP